MHYLSRFLLLVLGFTGTNAVFSLGSNLHAFAPKLDFHLNEEKLKEDYERAACEKAEARKYEQEQKERREREEREKKSVKKGLEKNSAE